MKFEYKMLFWGETVSFSKWLDQLNSLGQEGWEFVSIEDNLAYFKRHIK